MVKRELDLMQNVVIGVSKRQEHEGEFVINGNVSIGNYIVVDLLGEPVPYDTVYAQVKIVVMAWPLLVTFCSEREWFKAHYHIESKEQHRLMQDHLTKSDNVLSMARYNWKGHVWHAPKVNGHNIGLVA